MAKKTKKVKKKVVKLSKTKAVRVKTKKVTKKVKKKVTKKKVVKKKITKKKKKVKKRRQKRKIGMEDFYKILNKVQIKKKILIFAVSFDEEDVVENIIKDAQLKYNKTPMKTQVMFKLFPPEDVNEFEMMEIEEYLDDEIIDEGQIFP